MAEPEVPMVMRSVYLPVGMDEQLRALAFQLRLSKADLIRTFVVTGLEQVIDRLGPHPDEAKIQAVVQELGQRRLPAAQVDRSDRAVERMRVAAAETRRMYSGG